jgi:Cysteine-rich CPCC
MGAVEKFVNAEGPAAERPSRCPCCGCISLTERSADEFCPVCFWEDDGQDDHDADEVRGGPNRALSLTVARANFQAMGACDERCTRFVRPPLSTDIPKSSSP